MAFTKAGMKKLAAHHGLDPEVNTDDDIDNCLANSVSDEDMTELANRAIAGEQAIAELGRLREVQADNDLKTYENRIGTSDAAKKFWRLQFIANREAAIEALPPAANDGKPVVKDKPLHNREAARTPAPIEGKSEDARKALGRAVLNRAHELQEQASRIGRTLTFNQAHRQATTELSQSN